jgi:hypothetical protein
MFRTREMRLGPGALYTPGTAVPSRPGTFPDRRLPPRSGRSLSPRYHCPSRGVFVTRHQRGFTGVRPVQPSPRLWPPDGTGTLGLSPELHTPLSRTQRRMSGRGRASALPGVTSSASLTSSDALTHRERPHVAQVVESDLLPVNIQLAYDGHRDLLTLRRDAGTRPMPIAYAINRDASELGRSPAPGRRPQPSPARCMSSNACKYCMNNGPSRPRRTGCSEFRALPSGAGWPACWRQV